MTSEELDEIEDGLDIALPAGYRRLAKGRLREPIHNDPKSIIHINLAFRRGDFGDVNWPHGLFAFDHDGAGNYYCIFVDRPEDGVYFRDHETQIVTRETRPLESLLER